MMRTASLLLALTVGFLLSSCSVFSRAPYAPKVATVEPVTPPIDRSDYLNLISDGVGLVDAASKLCAVLASDEQWEMGYRMAEKAVEKLKKDGQSELFKAALLMKAKCSAMKADWETDGKQLEAVTEAGMEAAKQAGASEKNPVASYYLALNLGLFINHRGMKAILHVSELIQVLKTAGTLPDQDLGGPLRVLGILYVRAPSWPAGPGDIDEGVELLRSTAEKYPSHPLNHLLFAEALIAAGEKKKAAKELKIVVELSDPILWGDYAARWLQEADELKKKL